MPHFERLDHRLVRVTPETLYMVCAVVVTGEMDSVRTLHCVDQSLAGVVVLKPAAKTIMIMVLKRDCVEVEIGGKEFFLTGNVVLSGVGVDIPKITVMDNSIFTI